jgi:hypothetical protein
MGVERKLVDAPLALAPSEAEGDVAHAVEDDPNDAVGIIVGRVDGLSDDVECDREDASEDMTAVRVEEVVRGDGDATKEGIVKAAESCGYDVGVGFGLNLHMRRCVGAAA